MAMGLQWMLVLDYVSAEFVAGFAVEWWSRATVCDRQSSVVVVRFAVVELIDGVFVVAVVVVDIVAADVVVVVAVV